VHRVYRQVAQAAGVPLIGMGGIQTTEDALEFLLAGASAVAVGTALFLDPATPVKIADGLSEYLRQQKMPHISQLTGAVELPAMAKKPLPPNGLAGAQG
jgi:dihydroorotate dehydrogenase (NAD+) catalytic subunit